MKKIILLAVIVSFCCNSYSQNIQKTDSLILELKKAEADTSKVNILNEITDILITEKNPEAEKYALKAIDKSLFINQSEYFNNSLSLLIKAKTKDNKNELILQYLDSLFIRIKTNDFAKSSLIYLQKGLVLESIDSVITASEMYNQAVNKALRSKDTLTIIKAYINIGIFYKRNSNYTLALEALINALKLSEYSRYTDGIFAICINLGTIYEQMQDNKKAIELYKKAEIVIDKINDQNGFAIVNYKIGKIFLNEKKYSQAKNYLEKVYNIHVQRNDKKGLIVSTGALSGIAFDLKNYAEYFKWLNISLKNAELTQNQQGLASNYSSLGKYYFEVENDYKKAMYYYKKNFDLDLKKLQLSHIYLVYKQMSVLHEKNGDFKNALNYYKLYSSIKDSLFNSENIKKQTEIKLDYEFDKIQRQKEIENKIKETEQRLLLEKEHQQRNFFIVIGILAIILLIISLRSYLIKKKANKLLAFQKQQIEEKNEELFQQNAEIAAQRDYLGVLNNDLESKNTEIIEQKNQIEEIHSELKSSIHYAKQIQEAVFPSKQFIASLLADYFIIFKPRNIVSGDFYWLNKINNNLIIAVADCTGHGVPGAFMSMLGISFLNEIVRKKEITKASSVLNELRSEIINALQQKGDNGEQKDGMDVSFVAINFATLELQFAGANNPLYIVTQSSGLSNEPEVRDSVTQSSGLLSYEPEVRDTDTTNQRFVLHEVKPNKMPIGIHEIMNDFTNHEIQLAKGDILYLFSDGYADQFGGQKGKKFMYKQFKDLILANCQKSMNEQKNILETSIESWIHCNDEKFEQTDDITVLGIKI
ncbi:MAG: hypothetical protein A2033_17570 [Bacteroidetes bacterium GWA2_31_9]|nr:MAG: hypothetical protein A2033_17570 [Bacteroidetes bacterium GWA2_31_9]